MVIFMERLCGGLNRTISIPLHVIKFTVIAKISRVQVFKKYLQEYIFF